MTEQGVAANVGLTYKNQDRLTGDFGQRTPHWSGQNILGQCGEPLARAAAGTARESHRPSITPSASITAHTGATHMLRKE